MLLVCIGLGGCGKDAGGEKATDADRVVPMQTDTENGEAKTEEPEEMRQPEERDTGEPEEIPQTEEDMETGAALIPEKRIPPEIHRRRKRQ